MIADDAFSLTAQTRRLDSKLMGYRTKYDAAASRARDALARIPLWPEDVWIQSIASLLATLAHLRADDDGELWNMRRTRRTIPTYPSHPDVVESLVAQVFASVGSETRLRILDPTMEAGQLLLGVTFHFLKQPGKFPGNLRLLGLDHNPMAVAATRTAFRILEGRHQVRVRGLVTLRCENALRWLTTTATEFDVVLNNPPWGEVVNESLLESIGMSKSTTRESAACFVLLALRRLRENGRYGFTLPSPLLTGQRGRDFRAFIARETQLEHIDWLPDAAFRPATVRASSIVGTRRTPSVDRTVVVKRGGAVTNISTRTVIQAALAGWHTTALRITSNKSNVVPLSTIANVHIGAQLYCIGRGRPKQTAHVLSSRPFDSPTNRRGLLPAVRGRDVRTFAISKPRLFVQWGPRLARPGQLERGHELRVYVRELCRRDGALTVAAARGTRIALHGVLTIVPTRVDAFALTACLASPTMAAMIRDNCAGFAKKDFQRITVTELRMLPIPTALIESPVPKVTPKRSVAEIVSTIARRCAARPTPRSIERLHQLVASLYE